jgi:hypothetical protein
MNLRDLNVQLARALGVSDITHVKSVTLTLSANEMPTVRIERFILSADSMQETVEMLRLVPVPEKPPGLVETTSLADDAARHVLRAGA